MKLFHFFAVAMVLAANTIGVSAVAQHTHAQQKSAKPVRHELGTSVAVDAHGNLWAVSKEAASGGQYVLVQTSTDLGKTWSAPRRIQSEPEPVAADGENRPKIAFGSKGEMYISYTKPLDKPYTGDIRFVRSLDGGRTFSKPVTVHANRDVITHRFDALIVDREGRVYIAWIDKRDLHAAAARKVKYAGAALYYAVSGDAGASFQGDYKAADHSCECCRIALTLNERGLPVAMWRHVFEPNVRDHAIVELDPAGRSGIAQRATFDDWRIDACPHHGPALAYSDNGLRHQAWFSGGEGGGVFYATADGSGTLAPPQQLGSTQASHADLAVQRRTIVVAWKQFDGKETLILARISNDSGATWRETALASSRGASDQPRLLVTRAGIVLVWRTADEGLQTVVAQRSSE